MILSRFSIYRLSNYRWARNLVSEWIYQIYFGSYEVLHPSGTILAVIETPMGVYRYYSFSVFQKRNFKSYSKIIFWIVYSILNWFSFRLNPLYAPSQIQNDTSQLGHTWISWSGSFITYSSFLVFLKHLLQIFIHLLLTLPW